ncbi:acyl-CoA dehydrogenase C-terminal domain-containing protein [Sphingobium sp. HWE2-09]|uniref:acyl-CoA dehydrogenase C-terminal domain-containing protein n=1 Tax=Sphingobium sp. HWE2-09 TaxID=3108390 RepID=UPI002DD2AB6A|nr:acyl-CoA dehydrogenase C-terminal domain-containing protein [Sphingobium sp. HWE2-09]
MQAYAPPIDDYRFLLDGVLNFNSALIEIGSDVDAGLASTVLEAAGDLCARSWQPPNCSGDEQGSKLVNGQVTTPPGFADAYRESRKAGWTTLSASLEHGGQGLPFTLLRRMISGEWTGAMALAESGAGTDLALLKTRAVRIAKTTANALGLPREATEAVEGVGQDELSAADVDYLRLFAWASFGWMWSRMAVAAKGDTLQHESKIKVADYYAARILSQARGLAAGIGAGAEPSWRS